MGIQRVQNKSSWGLYVWVMDNGKPFADNDGNVLNLPGYRHDIGAMEKLRKAARYYNAPNGDVKFLAGAGRVSEARHSEERDRLAEGLIPSETDIDAWREQSELFEEYKRRGWDWERD